MEEAGVGELNDWELLQAPGGAVPPPEMAQSERDFGGIDGDSDGVIQSDYFALDSEKRFEKRVQAEEEIGEEGVVDSDNPSWVDPATPSRFANYGKRVVGLGGIELPQRNPGEFWSDSSSEESIPRKFGDFEEKMEFQGGDFGAQNLVEGFKQKGEVEASQEGSDVEHSGYAGYWSDSSGKESASQKSGESELGGGELPVAVDGSGESAVDVSGEVKSLDEGKKRAIWWKLPFEVLKFCVFRVSPVWSVSLAAAVMGLVILGRRLYKMKRKTRSIPLKVSMDDKKVSQFMIRAARLNEAFSVVKRVPVVRASLPAAGGVTPWPAMSLR